MDLPESVTAIADVIGVEATLHLIGASPKAYRKDRRYNSATSSKVILYIPKLSNLKADALLVRTVGWQNAVKLCKFFGGELLQPACCIGIHREFVAREVVRMRKSGMTAQHIAALLEITERHVRRIVQADIPPQEKNNSSNDNAPTPRKKRA